MKIGYGQMVSSLFAAAVCLLVCGCASCGGSRGESGSGGEVSGGQAARHFPKVTVPDMIAAGPEAAEYAAEHWWDGFTDTSEVFFCDSAHVNGVPYAEVEQAFADYCPILESVSMTAARRSVSRLFSRAEAFERHDPSSTVFETLADLAEKYFYDPNSPLRNEDFYLPFVKGLSEHEGFSLPQRDIYAYTAEMCALNSTGDKAADFEFSDRRGNVRTLWGISAGYVLLFFSNPGCESCHGIIRALEESGEVRQLISEGSLVVVNIYIDDDIAAWLEYEDRYPDSWYNGYDPNLVIRTDMLYNVRAIPSLYILDKNKRVIMKDAPETKVLAFLRWLGDQCDS